MRLRLPLSAKILAWLCLNLACFGLVFAVFFVLQFQVGLDLLLTGRAGERVQAVSEVILAELQNTPRAGWSEVLARFSRAYQVQFFLLRPDGSPAAGEAVALPPAVKLKLAPRPGRPEGGGLGPPRGGPPPWAAGPETRTPHGKFMVRTRQPTRYWVGVRLPLAEPDRPRPQPSLLLAVSDSMRGGGLFFDVMPWLLVGFGALLFSVLLWAPLVRGITRSITQLTEATERIAEGKFEVRVQSQRRDELGALAQAVNRMAGRLEGFVVGQKRFLGDIAHELCSPLARIQMALGILEQRADDRQRAYVNDVREEIQQMSALVNELLSFSKASLGQRTPPLQAVNLAALVQKVVSREAKESNRVEVSVEPAILVNAEPELLARALANLLRNAMRYGGSAGPITVQAQPHGPKVVVSVTDSGPGVPAADLDRIFDPFYRVEASRSRETGGVGLGLAIVKTCVEACQGSVQAMNCQPTGLRVEVTLNVSRL